MTPREHAELIERDRLVLLARLEAEALIEPSPASPMDTAPLVMTVPIVSFQHDAEVRARLERERTRRARQATYDRYVRLCARERRQRVA